ncbi:MAG: AAA family ATPase [Phycisphaeraceae bacterium]|nr:AAA family ATPase [Phycisphaeraceae bacterium]MBX3409895.1 AAA family ATPase [Phycisphaeraceae bacterium]
MTLQARSLKLTNFRCFREATLDLHPRLTVIVADNGMGKTALLDAIAVGMAEYVDPLLGVRTSRGLLPSDVRTAKNGGGPAQLSMTAEVDGQNASWSLTRKSATSPMRRGAKQLAAVRDVAARHNETVRKADSTLPLVVFYQSSRFAHSSYFGQKFGTTKTSLSGRLLGFADYLTPLSEAARFNEWYAVRWRAVAKRASPGIGPGQDPLAQLSAVRTAVAQVLEPTGWSVIDWDDERGCVVVEHATRGRLPLSWLSSGIRSMIALVADLAYRCACLNPHLGQDAATKTPGLTLIDEVDLHLHPSWQQRVVELLQAAFGSMQCVLTTHSPQVLSTVYSDSVRVVKHHEEGSEVTRPTLQTRGIESADILAKVMSVYSVPAVPESQWLSDYTAMVQSGRHESTEGRALWAKLVDHFGATHPALDDIAVIRRLQEFKEVHGLVNGSEGGSNAQA